MPLFGPRLDRPSAIGDEGRPRAASLFVASLVVLSIVGVAGVVLGWPSLLPTLGTGVGLAVAGSALLKRDRFADMFVGNVLAIAFGSALTTGALAGLLLPPGNGQLNGVAIAGFAVALLGIAMTWADVGGRDDIRRTLVGVCLTYTSLLCSIVGLGFLAAGLLIALVFLDELGGSSSMGSLVGFLFVTGSTAVAALIGLRWLPILELTPRERRPAVRDRLESLTLALQVAIPATFGTFLVSILFSATVGFESPAFRLLSSRFVLGPIVLAGVLSLGAGVLALVVSHLTRHFDGASARWIAAGLAGCFLAVLYMIALLGHWRARFVMPSMLLPLLSSPLFLAMALAAALVGNASSLIPDRADGPAIAAAGLVVAAIAVRSGPPPLVFACVAGAVVVWDVSTFGLGITAELGHVPETRRLEVFHGTIAVGIAVLAILALVGLELLRTAAFPAVGGTSSMALAVVGVLLVLVPLRG